MEEQFLRPLEPAIAAAPSRRPCPECLDDTWLALDVQRELETSKSGRACLHQHGLRFAQSARQDSDFTAPRRAASSSSAGCDMRYGQSSRKLQLHPVSSDSMPRYESNCSTPMGSNYSNTPIGGPTYVEEPLAQAADNQILFNLWASGKILQSAAGLLEIHILRLICKLSAILL